MATADDHRAPFAATVATISLVGMVAVGQLYVTIPLMPRMSAAWGVSQASAAWTTTAFAIAYACGSLLSGPLSNRYGRRAVMTVSTAAMAFATALVPCATSLGTGSAFRALQGLLAGAFVPMSYSYLSARIPARRLPLALTTVSCCLGGTVVIGQVEAQLLQAAFGWRAVFWITAPLLLLGAGATARVLLPDPARPPRQTATGPAPAGGRSRRLPLYLVTLTVAGSLTAVYTGVQLYGPSQLVGHDGAMLALRASGLPALLASVLIAPLLGRIPATRRAAMASAVAVAGLLAAALRADDVIALGVALFVFMLGLSNVGPALVQTIGSSAGAAQTTAIAVYGFMLNLGGGVGAQLPAPIGNLTVLALVLAALMTVTAAVIGLTARTGRRVPVPVPDYPTAGRAMLKTRGQ
ncbi:MFS transporter [Streptomyces sp. RPT161]|uniref:MFS transporter n=1 Tax=Streptomyces sp. RPT161 TaxID=3015993 RepID=UPI0022B903B2|nr:MFS transporter [Streptomyces sp. RPT161]